MFNDCPGQAILKNRCATAKRPHAAALSRARVRGASDVAQQNHHLGPDLIENEQSSLSHQRYPLEQRFEVRFVLAHQT